MDLHVLEFSLISSSPANCKLAFDHAEGIKRHFSQYGAVLALNFHLDMDGAFIIYEEEEFVTRAVREIRGSEQGAADRRCTLVLSNTVFHFRVRSLQELFEWKVDPHFLAPINNCQTFCCLSPVAGAFSGTQINLLVLKLVPFHGNGIFGGRI